MMSVTALTCHGALVLPWLRENRKTFHVFTVVLACSEAFILKMFKEVQN
jgi:hypothetical protein